MRELCIELKGRQYTVISGMKTTYQTENEDYVILKCFNKIRHFEKFKNFITISPYFSIDFSIVMLVSVNERFFSRHMIPAPF